MGSTRGKTRARRTPDETDGARAAVELVDEGGLGADHARRAARLEVDPMALYRIVPDRDASSATL